MKRPLLYLTTAAALLAMPAFAEDAPSERPENLSDCEVVMMRYIPDEGGNGGMDISTHGPADDYIASVYDDEDGHLTKMRGDRIRALLCQRDDLLPTEEDFPILATGIPFVLSQNFDSTDTDSLTMFWRKTYFDYIYKGHPLSDDAESQLKTRLAGFTDRDHGLNVNKEKAPELLATNSTARSIDDTAVKSADVAVETETVALESDDVSVEADETIADDVLLETEETFIETDDAEMESDDAPVESDDASMESDADTVETEADLIESDDAPEGSDDTSVESDDTPDESDTEK